MTEAGTPIPPPEVKPGLNEKLMESLNTNILKLAVRLEQTNLAEFVEVTQKPSRLLWTNFMAGLARGVGLFVGGGIMGALTLALLTWSIYHLLKVFDMIPIVNQLSKLLTKEVDTFLLQHHITR
jgi:hypothetical protein